MDHLHQGHVMRPSTGHESALRSVQKPPSKPWRGAGGGLAPAPTPPKVYRVEPREFRDLVQMLTGAPAAAPGPARQQHNHHVAQPVAVRAAATGGQDAVAGQMYASAAAPWCSFPLMAPAAAMHPGLDGHHLI